MTKPRIAVAGIHIESSTFTPYISTADDFIVTRGEELMDRFYSRASRPPAPSTASSSTSTAP